MKYRITFNPITSRFIVQVKVFWIFWCPCKNAEFEIYAEARHWVNSIGLSTSHQEQKPVISPSILEDVR